MKKYTPSEWFEQAKKTPTELSREEVNAIIQVIPTLPPPGNPWFKFFNFNSIIMTTLGIAILTSVWIFVSQPNADLTILNDDLFVTHSPTIPAPSERSNIENESIPAENSATGNENPKGLIETESKLSSSFDEINDEEDIRPTRQQVQIPGSNPTLFPPGKIESKNAGSKLDDSKVEVDGSADVQLKKLKRVLIRELAKDKLISDKSDFVVVKFMKDKILVNNQTLSSSSDAKYRSLLNEYQVEAGLNQQIAIDPEFIMVGEFTDEGFKGSALGKNMNIVFQKGNSRYKGLFSMSEGPTENLFSSVDAKGSNSGGNILLKTEGDVDDAEALFAATQGISTTNKGFFDGSKDDTSAGIFDTGKQSATIFDKKNTSKAIDLSAKKVASLKNELYRNLLKDELITTKWADVNMKIEPADIQANKQLLNPELQSKYLNILASYKISPFPDNKILMSKEFILAGEFAESNFTGTIQGRIEAEKVKGSIFESILTRYAIFGVDELNEISGTAERIIEPFHSLVVDGLALVYYTHGAHKNAKLKVTGMPMADVITNVKDGVLTVTTRGDYRGEFIRVEVGSKEISSIEIKGTGELVSQNMIKAKDLTISAREAGSAELKVDVQELKINMNGGDLQIRGNAKYKKVNYLEDSERGTLEDGKLVVENE